MLKKLLQKLFPSLYPQEVSVWEGYFAIPSISRAFSICLLPIDWCPTDRTSGDFTKVNDRWICAFDESDNSLRKRASKQETKITEYYIDILDKYISAEEAEKLAKEAQPYEEEYRKIRLNNEESCN